MGTWIKMRLDRFLEHRWLMPGLFLTILLVDITYSFYRLMFLDAGGDNQWYGAKLYWDGINPYTACLETPEPEWFMTAFTNYAPLLYVVLLPITYLDWEVAKVSWYILSLAGFLLALFLFYKKEGIPVNRVLAIAALVLGGSTLTNALYQGQISVLIFAMVSMAWIYRNKPAVLTILLSLIFTKYSFGLPLLVGFFLAGYYWQSISAFALNMLAVGVFAIQFDMGFVEMLKLPFEVASRYTSSGNSDIISLHRLIWPDVPVVGINLYSITAGIIYLAFAYICFFKNPSKRLVVTSSVLLSFSVFFHLDYDYSVLLAPVLIAWISPTLSSRTLSLLTATAAYVWLYPMVPKLIRTFFGVQPGITPVEWFGHTGGLLFIGFNAVLLTYLAFRILYDRNIQRGEAFDKQGDPGRQKDLYIFDFDGTLTRKDSLKEFILYCVGPLRYYLGLAKLSPTLVGYVLGFIKNNIAKERLMVHFFRGWKEAEFAEMGRKYAQEELQKIIRPSAWAFVTDQKSKGNDIIVVSASMEAWLKPWCESNGFRLLCTRMEVSQGKLTGKFANTNCYGAEKAHRLMDVIDPTVYGSLYAFGDSRGDTEMLAFADKGFYRYFH